MCNCSVVSPISLDYIASYFKLHAVAVVAASDVDALM